MKSGSACVRGNIQIWREFEGVEGEKSAVEMDVWVFAHSAVDAEQKEKSE